MNQQELETKRKELENRLKRMEETHSKKFAHIHSESAYRDSAKEINAVYRQLADVCDKLGDPIPVRF